MFLISVKNRLLYQHNPQGKRICQYDIEIAFRIMKHKNNDKKPLGGGNFINHELAISAGRQKKLALKGLHFKNADS